MDRMIVFVTERKKMDTQHMENNENTNEMKPIEDFYAGKKKGLGRGMLYGVAGTLLVGALLTTAVCKVAGVKILVTGEAGNSGLSSSVLDEKTVEKIEELKAYTDVYYYDETDETALHDGLYEGFISGLGDKYSVYYNAEDYAQLQMDTTGQYYGIGAGLRQDPDTMVVSVSKIYEGTPSDEAGLLAEDIILSVDDTDATSMEVTELVKLIRGEEGTTVHLEVYRSSTNEYLSFDVERANVTLPSISHEMLDNGIGYIRIDSFEKETANQFEEAMEDLENQGMKALILDVRYNGGGLVSSVVQILDDILPEGTVVYTEDKNGNRQDYTSSGDTYMDYPLAVLVNGDSASASEILAGAIKDYEYGTLIGTTTFGKGIVQKVFSLNDGSAVKLTISKYFTPNGTCIHGKGIAPDVEIEYDASKQTGEVYNKDQDNQLQKAIEVIKGKME